MSLCLKRRTIEWSDNIKFSKHKRARDFILRPFPVGYDHENLWTEIASAIRKTNPRTEAQALLIQCISRDPRMDSQVESRDEYYASIAIAIELPLEPLAEHLRQNDDPSQNSWATPLTVTTLTELAKRGYRNAGEILCDYIAWGQWWDWPIEDLRSLPGDRLAPRIASALEQHFPTKEMLDKAMQTWPTKQFLNLSRFSTRIEASLSKASTKTIVDSPRDLTSLTPVGLLALADEKNFHALGKAMAEVVGPANIDLLVSHVSLERPFVASVALAGLTKLAPLALSAWLPEFWLMCRVGVNS